ncbi:MAG: adenine deaminase [Candidatus Bathyarchaeota archaeon]
MKKPEASLEEIIVAARGDMDVDLLIKNASIINVFTGEIYEECLAIYKGYIIGFGEYNAKKVLNAKNLYVCPGFIDSHVHIESSMVTVSEYAKAVVPRGTTAVVADPHEIANVLGLDGIKFMIENGRESLLRFYVMLPSCVPATDMETSGALLEAKDLLTLIDEEEVIGLAEMMNYPGVVLTQPHVMDKLETFKGKVIDGHAPGLMGKQLYAYVSAGISSDHECVKLEEAKEKVKAGMRVMLREGSTEKNLKDLLPLVNEKNYKRFLFASDDRHPSDLLLEGHVDFMVKKAIGFGVDPLIAIQMATINAAEYFGLKRIGALAPGYYADFILLDSIKSNFNVKMVFIGGEVVAVEGKIIVETKPSIKPVKSPMNVMLKCLEKIKVPAEDKLVNVIEVYPDQILTRKLIFDGKIENGKVVSDVGRDILKVIVVERYKSSGNVGVGFVKGFGLKSGALGSSVAHDSHNIVAVGVDDEDLKVVVRELVKMGGGMVVVRSRTPLASLPLPIAGLMSDKPLETVKEKLDKLILASKNIGCTLPNPFMTLSFISLPVIPEIRLTDKGLVDVNKHKFISIFPSKDKTFA